ncbi:MAG: DUF4185 domain-containing protein [Trueperaceae bacterium]
MFRTRANFASVGPPAAFKRLALAVFLMAASAQAQPPEALIRSVETEKVAALTGPEAPGEMRRPDICGTDIGTMAELGGRIYFAFGDTFGYRGEECPKFGPNWRSNVLASTGDHDPADGIVLQQWLTGSRGSAVAMTEGAHQPAFSGEQTRIPTAMIAVEDRLYVHYMSVHGFAAQGGVWSCNFSRFLYSDDLGESWREAEEVFGDAEAGFNMLALAAAGEGQDRYVYAIGTPCGRFGGARAARVAPNAILDSGAWEYFTGDGWSGERGEAGEVIPEPVGEGSLVWNEGLGRWLYSYLNEHSAALELREALNPWGPWSEPVTLATAGRFPQLYGAYMTPSFISTDGRTVYFVMSQFGPYNTFIMKATLGLE